MRGARGVVWVVLVTGVLTSCRSQVTLEPIGQASPHIGGPRSEPSSPVGDDSTPPPRPVEQLADVALPADGQSLWLCADGRVRRWAWKRPGPDRLDNDCARGLRVSGDGTTVVTVSEHASWVHDVTTRDPPRELALELPNGDHVVDVALTISGHRVAVASEAGAVKVVDVHAGHVRDIEVAARPGKVRSSSDDTTFGRLDIAREVATPRLAWSGDGTMLALVAAVYEAEADHVRGRLFTWRIDDASHRSSEPFDVLDRRARGHVGVASSPTDRRFVVGSADGTVRMFEGHRLVWSSPAATAHASALAFSTDAEHFAVAYSDGAVRIFGPVGTSDAVELWPDVGAPESVAFSADGSALMLAVEDGPIAIVDTTTGEVRARLAVLDRGWVAVSPQGSVDGDRAGIQALGHRPVADLLGWEHGKSPSPGRTAGLLARLLSP